MLLIQYVCLQWGKPERGGKAAEIRSCFPLAYPLEDFPGGAAGEAFLHRLYFRQTGAKIMDAAGEYRRFLEQVSQNPAASLSKEELEKRLVDRKRHIKAHAYILYPKIEDVRLPGLALYPEGDSCRVRFFYDESHMGAPYRRGRNEDYQDKASPFFGKDILNETAFSLGTGQYGRILYNERKISADAGAWYYQYHIFNIIRHPDSRPSASLFLRKPDFCYTQLTGLYYGNPQK